MLPGFNEYGYLPKGIHKAALKEIEDRFGIDSVSRKDLFKNLNDLVKVLRAQKKGIVRFLVNGSYVISVAEPNDIDCIVVLRKYFDFGSREAFLLKNAKRLFNVHLFVFMEADNKRYKEILDFFGHDRDGRLKGLVEVLL
ncbi:DUF6932 family protein [Candidatus Omnitrophota bacterium]